MNNSIDVIQGIREEQLTKAIRFVAVFGFFVIAASLFRVFEIGWNNIFFIHIGLYLLILGLAVFGNHLTYRTKALFIIGLSYTAGISGLIALGLFSFGLVNLFSFCVITTILFGPRAGILSVLTSVFSATIIAAGFASEVLTYHFNAFDFLIARTTWIASIMAIVMSAGVVVVALSTINSKIFELVKNLDEKNRQLLEANAELEKSLCEKKMLKSGLERAQKMELVGTIAGGVAHDLNNVLSGSVSYPELILMELPEKSPLREPVEAVMKSGWKAAAIVHDLLTLTRRGVSAEEVVNINQVVKDYLASPEFEKIMKYHPLVQVELSLDDNIHNIINSPFHLSKTINNLVSNAAEAMKNGGKIGIETRNLFFNHAIHGFERVPAGEYVILKVKDAGSGIPRNELRNIFEPFYTKKVMGRSGTGLGMTVVWNTVKDHNGYIDIDSTEGEGTCFTLYFPITTKALEKPEPETAVAEYRGKGELILVVDDVEDQREIASTILSKLGYSVDTLSSGESAIEYLRVHSPDLVILDMIMAPGMDGLDTYKEILGFRPHQKTLIVSGFSESTQVREAQSLGAGAYISKPYSVEKIGLAVRGELDRKN